MIAIYVFIAPMTGYDHPQPLLPPTVESYESPSSPFSSSTEAILYKWTLEWARE